jgi:hypothetical protein
MAPGTRVFADTSDDRHLALAYAARLMQTKFDESEDVAVTGGEFLALASETYRWLVGPAALFLTIGPILKQGTREPTGREPGGSPMQLRDNEEVDLSVIVASAKGNEIADQPGTQDDLVWTVEGAEGVVEIEASADTRTCTVRAVDVGSSVVKVQLGELFATEAFDVIPGEAAVVNISAGTPRKQQPEGEPEVPQQG